MSQLQDVTPTRSTTNDDFNFMEKASVIVTNSRLEKWDNYVMLPDPMDLYVAVVTGGILNSTAQIIQPRLVANLACVNEQLNGE
jgi:hypothetical protein